MPNVTANGIQIEYETFGEKTSPTLVIHGGDDPLVSVEGGKDTAEALPGAVLMIIDSMGHDLPFAGGAWIQFVEEIVSHTKNVTG